MPKRDLHKENLSQTWDWYGNNVAITCPVCKKVYLTSGNLHRKGRSCPVCCKSKVFVDVHGKIASLEYDEGDGGSE